MRASFRDLACSIRAVHASPFLLPLKRILMISEKQVFAALPQSGFVRSYVEWAGQWLESNAGFHVSAALSILAQSVPTRLEFPGVTPLHANFYALIVGPSTVARKTRTIEAAQSVLKLALPGTIMVKPGSPEACVYALTGTPQILFYDEFGSLLQASETGQLAPLRMILTDLYDCGTAGRNLAPRGKKRKACATVEENPRLSLLGGVTPGLLEEYTLEIDWTEGFLARFFTLFGTAERKLPYAPFSGEGARDALANTLKSYSEFDTDPFAPTSIEPCKGFSVGAAHLWNSWCESIRERAEMGEYAIKAAIHRAQGHAIKIALLLAWDYGAVRSGRPWYVDLDALEPALAFTELHIQSVEEIAQGLAADRDMRDERRMLRAITDEPIAYGPALRAAHLVKKRGDDMIASLLEKGLVARLADSDPFSPLKYQRVKQETNVVPIRRAQD
jgi:hypothetical protein